MTQYIKIDQLGLPEGVPGVSRTDGLHTGATVTLTNTAPGTVSTEFVILWAPPGDTTAASSLGYSGSDRVWTFDPTGFVYGSWLIELIINKGTTFETRERRVFAVRTPGHGLVIPAHGEKGDRTAWLGDTDAERVDNNAVDYDAPLDAVPYAGWWRALHELIMTVDGTALPTGTEGQILSWQGFSWSATNGANIGHISTSDQFHVVTEGFIKLEVYDSGSKTSLDLSWSAFDLKVNQQYAINVTDTGIDGAMGETQIGFFGVLPVTRPTVVGSTTQQQIDSIIAALAALGLVTDGR